MSKYLYDSAENPLYGTSLGLSSAQLTGVLKGVIPKLSCKKKYEISCTKPPLEKGVRFCPQQRGGLCRRGADDHRRHGRACHGARPQSWKLLPMPGSRGPRHRSHPLSPWWTPKCFNPSTQTPVRADRQTRTHLAHFRPGESNPCAYPHRPPPRLGRAATAGGEQMEVHEETSEQPPERRGGATGGAQAARPHHVLGHHRRGRPVARRARSA